MTKILYLEDEHYLGRIVKESLASRGYDIKLVTDGVNVMRIYKEFQPDICVFDIMVPNIDGLTLGADIRQTNPSIPIIFLTAKNQTEDVLLGFKSGGNDYIKKPFSMEELIVRIENLLKIKGKSSIVEKNEVVDLGKYKYHYQKFQLQLGDNIISLSYRENELLFLLTQNINQRVDRSLILQNIWGNDSLYNSRNLDVYIRKLRIYFENDPKIQLITLRGVGYHFSILQD